MKKKSRKFIAKINLSDWDMGDWPTDLFKAVKHEVEHDEYGLEIKLSLDSDIFTEAARQIATQAIRSFLDDCAYAWFTAEGIELRGENKWETFVLLPWSGVMDDREGLAALRAWLDEQEAEIAEG